MKVYTHLPKMLKWKKFFLYFCVALAFIFYVHTDMFLLVMSLISLVVLAFLTLVYAIGGSLMGNTNDLRYITKLFWYREYAAGVIWLNKVDVWCEENLDGKWIHAGNGYYIIKDETDVMAFKLRWS